MMKSFWYCLSGIQCVTGLVIDRLVLIYAIQVLSVTDVLLLVDGLVRDMLPVPAVFLPVPVFFLKKRKCIFIIK